MTKLIVRRPLETDRAAWETLWTDYLRFYETTRPPELYARNYALLLAGEGPLWGYLAFDRAGQALGLVHYFLHGTAWRFGDNCYLQDLFVAPESRGAGVATGLIDAVAEDARQRGCEQLYWQTHEQNRRARALYDRVAVNEGFIVYSRDLLDPS